MLNFIYTNSFQDYRRALRLVSLNTTRRRWLEAWFGIASPYIGGIFLLAAISIIVIDIHFGGQSPSSLRDGLFGWFLGAGIILLVHRPLYVRRMKRYYNQQDLRGERIAAFDDQGIRIDRTDGREDSRTDWTLFEKWIESRHLFVVLMNQLNFYIFPKSALDQTTQDQVRMALETHVPRGD